MKCDSDYPENGANSWRAANDQVFIDAAKKINSERRLKPADPKYIDPEFIKGWAMVESGSGKDKSAFLRDPSSVIEFTKRGPPYEVVFDGEVEGITFGNRLKAHWCNEHRCPRLGKTQVRDLAQTAASE